MGPIELWFHGIEVAVLLFGVAAPIIWASMRLRSVLKDFPPHRHINGTILYPRGYEPVEAERLGRLNGPVA